MSLKAVVTTTEGAFNKNIISDLDNRDPKKLTPEIVKELLKELPNLVNMVKNCVNAPNRVSMLRKHVMSKCQPGFSYKLTVVDANYMMAYRRMAFCHNTQSVKYLATSLEKDIETLSAMEF